MKNQKGITLVALIITIIVMLILVAVTISIALNGGLFDKARTASRETRIAQVNEAIALAKADIVSDYYDPTNTTASESRTTTYLGAAPTAAKVTDAVNAYLDPERISVTASGTNGSYTFTINQTYNGNPINTDLADANGTLSTISLDMWTTTSP